MMINTRIISMMSVLVVSAEGTPLASVCAAVPFPQTPTPPPPTHLPRGKDGVVFSGPGRELGGHHIRQGFRQRSRRSWFKSAAELIGQNVGYPWHVLRELWPERRSSIQ